MDLPCLHSFSLLERYRRKQKSFVLYLNCEILLLGNSMFLMDKTCDFYSYRAIAASKNLNPAVGVTFFVKEDISPKEFVSLKTKKCRL